MPDVYLRQGHATPADVILRDPTTADAGGGTPQTLVATACVVAVSAPVASADTAVTLAAGQNTVTSTAPTATLAAAISLAAGANVVSVTAPAAAVTTAVTLAATANVVTVSAPTAALSASTLRRIYYYGRMRHIGGVRISRRHYYVDEAA